MDCKTARLVWNHPRGVIHGLTEHLPEAMAELSAQVRKFIEGVPDPFDTEVKFKSGIPSGYRLEHSDGESTLAQQIHSILGDAAAKNALEEYFSFFYGRRISLANICCSSHQVSDGTLTAEEQYKIQLAAVNTEPTS